MGRLSRVSGAIDRPGLMPFAIGYLAGHYLFRWFVLLTKVW